LKCQAKNMSKTINMEPSDARLVISQDSINYYPGLKLLLPVNIILYNICSN